MRCCLLTASPLLLWAVASLAAQTINGVTQKGEIPAISLEFGHPEDTSLGKKGTVMSADPTCSEDGTLFVEIADSLEDMYLVLHSLKNATDAADDVSFSTRSVPGYTDVSPPVQYFANDRNVAALVEANPSPNPLEQNKAADSPQMKLVLIYDRKGPLQHVVPVPVGIDIKTVGLYRSGDILVVAMDQATRAGRFIVMDTEGNVKNEFLPFDNDYNTKKNARAMQPLAAVGDAGAFLSMQVVPYGNNLLLFPKMTSHAIVEVNEQGVVHSTQLQLPRGYTLSSFLSASPSSWKIKTFAKAETWKDVNGTSYGTLMDGPVFEFNPSDGSLIRRIDMPKDSTARLVCEHNGDYTALTTDAKTGRLQMLKGYIPR